MGDQGQPSEREVREVPWLQSQKRLGDHNEDVGLETSKGIVFGRLIELEQGSGEQAEEDLLVEALSSAGVVAKDKDTDSAKKAYTYRR